MSKAGAAYFRKLKGIPEIIPTGYKWKHRKSNSAIARDNAKAMNALLKGHN